MINIIKEFLYSNPLLFKIFRFIISGGTAAVADLLLLFILTKWFGLWYLLSSIVAYIGAFFVGFILQKYWTFDNKSKEVIYRQAARYFSVTIFNLLLNTLLMSLAVDYLEQNYLISQFVINGLIAFESYFLYKIIFSKDLVTVQSKTE